MTVFPEKNLVEHFLCKQTFWYSQPDQPTTNAYTYTQIKSKNQFRDTKYFRNNCSWLWYVEFAFYLSYGSSSHCLKLYFATDSFSVRIEQKVQTQSEITKNEAKNCWCFNENICSIQWIQCRRHHNRQHQHLDQKKDIDISI